MSKQKVISASDAARLIPDGAIVTVSSSSALGCPDAVLAAIGRPLRRRGASAQHHHAASDRRRRHVGHQGHRPSRQARLSRARSGGLLSVGPVLRRAAGDLEDDQRQRDPRLQRAVGHSLRHASRGRGEAPGRADQGRHGHLRRSGARGLRDEREGAGGADRQPASRSRARTGCSFRRSRRTSRSSARPRPTSAATSPTSTRAASSAARSGARRAQQWRHRHRAGEAPRRGRHADAARRAWCRACFVDHIVVAPDQLQTTQTPYDPAISGEIFRPLSSFETPKFDVAKVIARRVAQELRDGDAVNIGFGISANVPRILIEEGQHGAVTWVIEQGAVGGVPLLDFQFGCASNAEAIVPVAAPVHLFPGRRLRHVAAVVPADRPLRLGQRLQASACGRM